MRITAKHAGHCTSCGRPIEEGSEVEWERVFGARCVTCAENRKYPERPNRIAAWCYRCDTFVDVGKGALEPKGSKDFQVRCAERRGCDIRADLMKKQTQAPEAEA
jgi:hypothetical protein